MTGPRIPDTEGVSGTFAALERTTPIVQGFELHLYVVEFISSGVKVGVSGNPQKRIAQHRRDAAAFGLEVGRVWVSAPHVESEARRNEHEIKKLAGIPGVREYLPIDYESAVKCAEGLPKTRVTAAVVAAQRASTEELFEFALGRRGRLL